MVAPVAVEQRLELVGGGNPPTQGQESTFRHTTTLTNTSAQALDLRLEWVVGEDGVVRAFARRQGQSVALGLHTDYAPDTTVVSASANVGQTSLRGQSVSWTGQLQAGESVVIERVLAQPPTNSLSITEPIRGQSLTVTDPVRGQRLALSAPAQQQVAHPPPLPPAQRVVQPPPPPVDPITLAPGEVVPGRSFRFTHWWRSHRGACAIQEEGKTCRTRSSTHGEPQWCSSTP